jgi:hypothetical protein
MLVKPMTDPSNADQHYRNELRQLCSDFILAATDTLDFKKSLDSLNRKLVQPRVQQSQMFAKATKWEESLHEANRALEIQPAHIDACLLRVQAQISLHLWSDSFKSIDEFVSKEVMLLPAQKMPANLQFQTQCHAILSAAVCISQHIPCSSQFYACCGKLNFAVGNTQVSCEEFSRAIHMHKDVLMTGSILDLFLWRGACSQILGHHDDAIKDFSTIIQHDPCHDHALMRRASVYKQLQVRYFFCSNFIMFNW